MSSTAASGCPTGHSFHSFESVHEAHELVVEHFTTMPIWLGCGVHLPPQGHVGFQLAGCSWRYMAFVSRNVFHLYLACIGRGRIANNAEEYPSDVGVRRVTVALSSGGHVLHELSQENLAMGPKATEVSLSLAGDTLAQSIVDDTLVIRTEAIVCADPSRCVPTRSAAAPEATAGAFAQGMAQLLISGQGSDAVIVAGQSQRRFPVHRAVVAAHSPVLRAALWGNGCGAVFAEQRAGEVRLEDVDEGLMSVLLEFLYTGASASDVPGAPVDLYMQLAMLADRLDVAMLRDLCAARVAQRISADRLADVLALADSCRMGSLRDACVQWVACHRHVLRMPGVLEALGSDACRELLVSSMT
eukprot:m51a1_g389 hypothetical protein (358) ;mRNA; r:694498-695571